MILDDDAYSVVAVCDVNGKAAKNVAELCDTLWRFHRLALEIGQR